MSYTTFGASALSLAAIGRMKYATNPKPRREWRTMPAPHDRPLNPFESRQVRRARERKEKQP